MLKKYSILGDTLRWLRSARAYAQSSQILCFARNGSMRTQALFKRPEMTPIRLDIRVCPIRSKSTLGAKWTCLFDYALDRILFLDVDECGTNPCKRGSSCTNSFGSYSCDPCPSGYNGTTCDTSKFIFASARYFGTHRIGGQRRLGRVCTYVQTHQSLRFSHA